VTTKYHLSVKGPAGELLGVQAEGEGDQVYSEFMAAVADLDLQETLRRLSTTAAAAPATAVAALPVQAVASQRAAEPWGNPPVPPMPAAAAPAGGAPGPAPTCQHGTKLYREGTSAANGRAWRAWFCPAPGNDPTQCAKQWLR
jgi:hypothetical protein